MIKKAKGLIIQCPGAITKCPEIMIMYQKIAPIAQSSDVRVRTPLEKHTQFLFGIIQPSHLARITVPQCPGIT